jgi:DNA-binding CsgD family transcriptional regulator
MAVRIERCTIAMIPLTPAADLSLNQLAFTMEALAPIADAVGSPRFLPALFDSIARFVDCDSLHLDCVQPSSTAHRVGWLGSFGRDPEKIEQTMRLYYRDYAGADPSYAHLENAQEVKLVQLSVQRIDEELRRTFYDVADIHDECVAAYCTNGMRYSLSVCRARRLPPFSLKELSILKHLATLVLPLAAAHKRLAGAIPLHDEPADQTDDRLAQWLPHLFGKLTPRESRVCSAFVQGMSTTAVAKSMGIKPSTVDTYAKRAFAKLGIESRRQLLALVFRSAPAGKDGIRLN